jgi:hypothetical protein
MRFRLFFVIVIKGAIFLLSHHWPFKAIRTVVGVFDHRRLRQADFVAIVLRYACLGAQEIAELLDLLGRGC